ncbi:MAG: hypothetical protein ACJ74O_18055 [Frankiaceae bacterium]
MVASLTSTTTAPADEARGRSALRWLADRLPTQPMQVVMLLVTAISLVLVAGPESDVDLWWHVKLGNEILHRHSAFGVGTTWSFAPVHGHWTSSEWLSEVVLAGAHDIAGWSGISWLRVLLTAWLFYRLYRLIVPGRALLPASVVFCVTVGWLGATIQERPQLASLILLTWLAGHAREMLRGSTGPRLWVVAALTVLWANVHGLWVMVPTVLALLAAGRLLDSGRAGLPSVRRPALLALVAVLAGCVTPLGPRGLLLPFVLKGSTHFIAEWGPTVVADKTTFGLLALTVPLLVVWARSGTRVPRSEVLYVLALLAFAMVAFRSLPPAVVLLAPICADRLSDAWTRPLTAPRPAERVVLATVAATAAALCVLGPVALLVSEDPLPRSALPLGIAARLAAEPGEHRVLNSYNASGVLLEFGGPRTKVAVDGRAERYGGAYIDRYLATLDMRDDWQGMLRELRPTHAVLYAHAVIVQALKERGWRVVIADDSGFTLLEPPR